MTVSVCTQLVDSLVVSLLLALPLVTVVCVLCAAIVMNVNLFKLMERLLFISENSIHKAEKLTYSKRCLEHSIFSSACVECKVRVENLMMSIVARGVVVLSYFSFL
jgi:hypothetical protein